MFIISVVVVRKNHRCVFFIGIEGAAGIGSSCCCLSCCCGIILATITGGCLNSTARTSRSTATSIVALAASNSGVAPNSAAVRVTCSEAASSTGAATATAVTDTAETSDSSSSLSALD